MNLKQAQEIAVHILSCYLNPAPKPGQKILRPCAEVMLVGSVRRGKHNDIKDLEFAVISAKSAPVFGGGIETPFESLVKVMIDSGMWRLHERGTTKQTVNGPRMKALEFYWRGEWVTVEFFIATENTWGNIVALRTGPAGFMQMLVTRRDMQAKLHNEDGSTRLVPGLMPLTLKHDKGALWRLEPGSTAENPIYGKQIFLKTEADYFKVMELPFVEPHQRSVQLAMQWAAAFKEKVRA